MRFKLLSRPKALQFLVFVIRMTCSLIKSTAHLKFASLNAESLRDFCGKIYARILVTIFGHA